MMKKIDELTLVMMMLGSVLTIIGCLMIVAYVLTHTGC